MKKIDTAKITAFRTRLLEGVAAAEKASQDLVAAETDLEKLDARIAELSAVLDYRNESIGELPTLRLKRELAAKMVERLGALDAAAPLRDLVGEGGLLIAEILSEIARNRFQTVVASLLPFSTSRQTAEMTAAATDAMVGAGNALRRFGDMGANLRRTWITQGDPRPRCIADSRTILAILEQAISKQGDLLQYLPFEPHPGVANSEPIVFLTLRARQAFVPRGGEPATAS